MIDWTKVDYFTRNEFSENPDAFALPELIYRLDKYRVLLDEKIYPSPASGALARFSGRKTSRHYAKHRPSDANDVFPEGSIFHAWTKAVRSRLFKGIGVYFDTHYKGKPWGMLHLDLRPNGLLWFRQRGHYFYETDEHFWEMLCCEFADFEGV